MIFKCKTHKNHVRFTMFDIVRFSQENVIFMSDNKNHVRFTPDIVRFLQESCKIHVKTMQEPCKNYVIFIRSCKYLVRIM